MDNKNNDYFGIFGDNGFNNDFEDISSQSNDKKTPSKKSSDENFSINTDFMSDFDDLSLGNSKEDDNIDLFSYNTSVEDVKSSQGQFDLNAFSSNTEAPSSDPKKKKKGKKRFLKIALVLLLIGLIMVSIIVGAFMFYAFVIVDVDEDIKALDITNELDFTTVIYGDKGDGEYVEYQRLSGEFNRIWIEFDRVKIEGKDKNYDGIPLNLANAFVAIEDKRFFDHDGIDWKRTTGALINEIVPIYSSRQGGSTITQQLVKNITSDNQQTADRKVREIMNARYLEGKFSKDEILECYLNTIPMGHGTYGVEVAANYYFNKSVNELTIAECACLASITKAPSYYAPDTDPQANKERRESVLKEMYDQKFITEKEYDAALNEKIKIVADKDVLNQQQIYSYFTDALIEQVTDDLVKVYGYDKATASDIFYTSGFKIYSTVNPTYQKAAEKVFGDTSYAIKGKGGAKMTGAITVMDYSGNVKALVGGIGKKTTNRGFNCATDAVRQPGSTMKPLAAYAPAVEQNLVTYSSLLNDTKTKYGNWTPKNWYGSYWGEVTTQYALERSINSIPVYLVNNLGVDRSFKFLTEKLGVTTLNEADKNLAPLGMGGTNGGLTTIESAAAFATFGNGGVYYKPVLYTKIENQDGEVILETSNEHHVAMSEDTATIMNHLLQTVVYGSKGTGGAAKSYIPKMKIYAKTGTSNDQNDLWFVGGTPHYVASVWCGYEEMLPIPSSQSGIALKMWGNVMKEIHKNLLVKKFIDSSYVAKHKYCQDTGLLATEFCKKTADGWYKKSFMPQPCDKHVSATTPETDTGADDTQNGEAGTETDNTNQ